MALTIAPGPDNLFILAQGITRGRKPAIVTALGMCSGVSVHTLAAALGISALFYSSALAFTLLKAAGAAYLFYLAWKTFRDSGGLRPAKPLELPAGALFRRGFLMNVLNPKVALFFLAFLPQFVSRDSGSIPAQMLLLGLLFMAQAVVLFGALGYFAGGIGGFLLSRPRIARHFNWLTGGIFVALGLRIALVER
jgi:threonine/homoserine/homoserine lactone efflux protein